MKRWYQSKTIWLNVITLTVTILALPEVLNLIPTSGLPWVVAFQAAANVMLRLLTKAGISNDA